MLWFIEKVCCHLVYLISWNSQQSTTAATKKKISLNVVGKINFNVWCFSIFQTIFSPIVFVSLIWKCHSFPNGHQAFFFWWNTINSCNLLFWKVILSGGNQITVICNMFAQTNRKFWELVLLYVIICRVYVCRIHV